MTIPGLILLVLGILFSRFLSPPKDSYNEDFIAIKHMLLPKIIAILLTVIGLIILIFGLLN